MYTNMECIEATARLAVMVWPRSRAIGGVSTRGNPRGEFRWHLPIKESPADRGNTRVAEAP